MNRPSLILLPLLMAVLGRSVLWSAPARADDSPSPSVIGEPGIGSDDRVNQLAYDIYLANGNVAAAYRVAEKMVREEPTDMAWRKRLAQVASWLGKPSVSLANWLVVAEQTNSNEAWQQVGRLAPALNNYEVVVRWRRYELQKNPSDAAAVTALISAFERVGRPEAGLAFLADSKKKHATRAIYEAEAGLAQRTGHDELALADLRWLNTHAGPREEWLVRAAILHFRRGELIDAERVLAAAKAKMPETAENFWRTYAQLSLVLGKEEQARLAFGHVYASGHFERADLINYAALMAPDDPLAAAKVYELAFKRFGHIDAGATALYLWLHENRSEHAQAFLAGLTAKARARLEGDVNFLESRGNLYVGLGDWRAAMADYAAGLRLAPHHRGLQQAWISQFIEHSRPRMLRRFLIDERTLASTTPALWSLWASGWLRLDNATRALPWLRRSYQAAPENALNALAYADGLRRAGLEDSARLVETTVWQTRNQAVADVSAEDRAALEQALLEATLQRLPVDARRQRLAKLVQKHLNKNGRVPPWVRGLVLSAAWALQSGPSLPAYVSTRLPVQPDTPLPAWSVLSAALVNNDKPLMSELLATRLDELPAEGRIEAAERLGRFDLAATLGFSSAELQPNNDEIHRRFQDRAWRDGSWIEASFHYEKQGNLTFTPLLMSWKGHLDGNRALRLYVGQTNLSIDSDVLRLSFDKQRRAGFGFMDKGANHKWALWLTALDSQDEVFGLRAEAQWTLAPAVTMELGAGWHQLSTGTFALRVAGRRNFVGTELSWSITGRDQLTLDTEYSRLQAQGGGELGSMLESNLGYIHRLLSGDNDWALKTGVSNVISSTASTLPSSLKPLLPVGLSAGPEYFVPSAFTQFGASLAYGENAEQRHQRGWRSFGEAGLIWAVQTGLGYQYRFGLLGRVLGNDRLRIYIDATDSAQSSGQKMSTIGIEYRLFY